MAKVLIVGAGAAGLMAAGAAVRQGHQVTVLEHMDKPAQKILVTGKGRCNVTNDCTAEEFLRHVRTNPRFLFSSLGAFPPAKTMELFESLGVELKVERGRRVFPVSDKAEEIRQALLRYAQDAELVHDGAGKLLLEELLPEAEEAPAVPENPRHPKKKKAGPALHCIGVRGTSGREYRADAVLVATGGVSYPTTGSTGDGYKLARQAGHTLVEPVPSLVSLVSHDPDCKKMMGLALKNVTLTLFEDGKAIFDEQGEMLFTHFGISGPLTLSASSHLGDMKKHKYHAEIDLKPALSEEQLYDRITRDFALLANHAAQGALVKLLPSSMQPVMVARWASTRPPRPTRSPGSRSGSWCSSSSTGGCPSTPGATWPMQSSPPAAYRCGRWTPRPCRAKRPWGCTLQARCWTWTPTPAATTCRSLSARLRALPITCNGTMQSHDWE